MIFCVVPPELADELFDRLTEHYADDPNVTVIIDQRRAARRGRRVEPTEDQRRELRDRRRRRMPGDVPALEGE